jgi:hypothetical protein
MLRILLLLAAFDTCFAGLFIHSSGAQELVPYNTTSSVMLPNTTVLGDAQGELNLLQELRALRILVTAQQQQLNSLAVSISQKAGCAWSGLACHCYYGNISTDSVTVLGSNCTNGTLMWTKIMDTVVAASVIGCSFFSMSYCDVFY